jgi:hypothetical protein
MAADIMLGPILYFYRCHIRALALSQSLSLLHLDRGKRDLPAELTPEPGRLPNQRRYGNQ